MIKIEQHTGAQDITVKVNELISRVNEIATVMDENLEKTESINVNKIREELLKEIDSLLMPTKYWVGGRLDTIKNMLDNLQKLTQRVSDLKFAMGTDLTGWYDRANAAEKKLNEIQNLSVLKSNKVPRVIDLSCCKVYGDSFADCSNGKVYVEKQISVDNVKGLTAIHGQLYVGSFKEEYLHEAKPFSITVLSYSPVGDKKYILKLLGCLVTAYQPTEITFLANTLINWKVYES